MDLPRLRPNDWAQANELFQRLARAALVSANSDGFGFTVAGIGVRFGTKNVTYTASATSATATVTHGLGKTPVVIVLGFRGFGGTVAYNNENSTTFQVQGGTTFGAVSGTFPISWVAIG